MRAGAAAALLLGALAGGLLAHSSLAAPATSAQSCVRIAANSARLACYDAAFGVAVALPQPQKGASPPGTAPEFGDRGQLHGEREVRESAPKRLDFKLKKAQKLAGGLYRLTLDNGQIWVTKEADWALDFNAGDAVTIQRMALGGYRVSHAGNGRDVTAARIF